VGRFGFYLFTCDNEVEIEMTKYKKILLLHYFKETICHILSVNAMLCRHLAQFIFYTIKIIHNENVALNNPYTNVYPNSKNTDVHFRFKTSECFINRGFKYVTLV